MAAQNYVLLERIELNADAASVTFANIPQTGYTDLKIVMSARDTASASAWYVLKLQFNSDTTDGNYSTRILYGFGSTAGSGTSNRQNTGYITSDARTANTFNNLEMYIPNYTGSSYKSFSVDSVTEGNGSSFEILGFHAGLWSATAAITQVVLAPDAGSFAQYSTFSLYGLAAVGTTPAIAPKASGGDVIDYDGTYWIHTFLTSGTFTPQTGLTCDYLVVAGGGGGGYNQSGGGGAGGLRSTVTATGGGGSLESAISVASNTSYTITVGAGGAGATASNTRGSNGTSSTFSTITSIEGGGGGAGNATNNSGNTGGSGGGGGNPSNGTGTGGSGTANQGYAGGNGSSDNASYRAGGGGGGAGAIGANSSGTSSPNQGGNGGNGVAVSITGTSVTYAGGGGGGAGSLGSSGGTGGGGAGTNTSVGGVGTINLGGGGGGGGNAGSGGAGGSGIVIIRYLAA
jgi:hypothetical protein